MKVLLRPHICSFWNEKSGFGYSTYCPLFTLDASVAKHRFLAPQRHLHHSLSLNESSRYEPSRIIRASVDLVVPAAP